MLLLVVFVNAGHGLSSSPGFQLDRRMERCGKSEHGTVILVEPAEPSASILLHAGCGAARGARGDWKSKLRDIKLERSLNLAPRAIRHRQGKEKAKEILHC